MDQDTIGIISILLLAFLIIAILFMIYSFLSLKFTIKLNNNYSYNGSSSDDPGIEIYFNAALDPQTIIDIYRFYHWISFFTKRELDIIIAAPVANLIAYSRPHWRLWPGVPPNSTTPLNTIMMQFRSNEGLHVFLQALHAFLILDQFNNHAVVIAPNTNLIFYRPVLFGLGNFNPVIGV